MRRESNRFVIGRENNVVRVDFSREPDPPAPKFPGAGALRDISGAELSVSAAAASKAASSNFPDIDPHQCSFFCSVYGNEQANLTRGVGHG
jgi:hypothetical protein